jgi:hypothetical protein
MTPTRVRELKRQDRAAIVVVALHRREHGFGPSWGWLSRELRLPRDEGTRLIRRLHRAGFLSSTEEANSLEVTPDGLNAALRRNGRR